MSKEKSAQQIIDENEEFELDLERQGMKTIEKLKKQELKNAPSRN